MPVKLRAAQWSVVLRRRAKQLGLTQDELAAALGVTRAAVGHYMSGRREPDIAGLKALARTLRMSVSELVGDPVASGAPDVRDEMIARLERELSDLRSAAQPLVAALTRRGAGRDSYGGLTPRKHVTS